MSKGTSDQIAKAYKIMTDCNYMPAAPSDGCGGITGPLDLDAETKRYAGRWWKEEDSGSFNIGCCNFSTRVPTILAVEAARLLCSGSDANEFALRLLRRAVQELERPRETDAP